MSIGKNIKRLRLEHGLDQAELGRIAGVSDKAVSSWENDISIPRMGAIEKIANYFQIRKSDIIEEQKEKRHSETILSNSTYAAYDELTRELSPKQIEQLKSYAEFLRSQK